MKKDYELISYLLRGSRRKAVLQALDKPKTPKEIAKECKISTSNVSNALQELLKIGLVECITPKAHFYRFYQLTKLGKETIKKINELKR